MNSDSGPVVLFCPDQDAERVREYCRTHPQLIKDEYDSPGARIDPLTSLCYPLSEAYYHLRDCELDVYCLNWNTIDNAVPTPGDEDLGTHWYLCEPNDGPFIDLGLGSPVDADGIPYDAGTRRGFITGDTPSKRAVTILEAVTGREWSR